MLIDSYRSMIVRFVSQVTRGFLLPLLCLSLDILFEAKENLWDQGNELGAGVGGTVVSMIFPKWQGLVGTNYYCYSSSNDLVKFLFYLIVSVFQFSSFMCLFLSKSKNLHLCFQMSLYLTPEKDTARSL